MRSSSARFSRQPHDLGPALHQAVIAQRLGRALLALAQCVEAITQLARHFGLGAELGDERRRRVFAAGFQRADQLVHRLPGRQPRIGRRVPVGGQFGGFEQAHAAALRGDDARVHHAGDGRVLALGQLLGDAVFALGKTDLLEPGQRPAAVGVEVAFLLGQRLVQRLVDQRQRLAHRKRLAFGVEHFAVAGIDRHARADGRLRQVHRRDVAGLQVGERGRQFGLERGDEFAACGHRCGDGTLATNQHDAGRKSVGSGADHPVAQLGAHRPGAADCEAGADHGIEERLPAGAGGALGALRFGLLESVVDGDRERRMCLLGEAVHGLRHAAQEEGLGLLLAALAIRRGNEFLCFGHGQCGKEVGEDGSQRAPQPDVEEVRQVGVADVVVVRRVRGDDLSNAHVLGRSIGSSREAHGPAAKRRNCRLNPIERAVIATA